VGHPDEKELRKMDRKLTQIENEKKSLIDDAINRGETFQLGLPGSHEEQKRAISVILDHELDALDVSKRLRKIKFWRERELQPIAIFGL
jgi:phosphoribosylpyrophosphate synthetase